MISELRGQYRDAWQEESTVRRQGVAADVSRRILFAAKMAPTDVCGYAGMECPGQVSHGSRLSSR